MESISPNEPTIHQLAHLPSQRANLQNQREQLGKYRLIRLLAHGGFASVYLGEHVHLTTLAAIKVLHTSLESSDQNAFRKEARIVARLRHPHIIRVHDFDIEDGIPFLIMDYAPNGNLRQRHPRGSILSPDVVLHYLKQISPALHYAHDQRLIHRDLKPENILIGDDENILLSDFGIALTLSTQAQTEQDIVGTLSYMAPEQWQGRPLLASDQYALGVIVYEWLAGHCPFQGSPAELAAQHMNLAPPSLCEQAQIAPALEAVVFKALAKNPEERFPDSMGFMHAFAAAMQPQQLYLSSPLQGASSPQTFLNAHQEPTVQAKLLDTIPAHPPAQPAREMRISRRVALAGAGGALVIGAGGGLGWLLTHQHQPPKTTGHVSTSAHATPTPGQPALGTTLHTYRGHHDSVNGLATSPDGSLIVSASSDTTVQVWDTSTGGVNTTVYSGHTAAVNAVAWSSDGAFIVSGSDDASARVWKISDGSNPVSYTQHSGAVEAVAWSPDNQSLASGSADTTVQIWTVVDGTLIFTYSGHSDQVHALAWSPTSNPAQIASGSADTTVQIWNASDGSNAFTYKGHSGPINAVAWSPDGSLLATGSSDKTVRVWQAKTGNLVSIYGGHSDVVKAVAWSPDGSLIASASTDNTVQVWQAADGGNSYTYQGHSAAVNALVWLPNTRTDLSSGSADTTVQIWQATG